MIACSARWLGTGEGLAEGSGAEGDRLPARHHETARRALRHVHVDRELALLVLQPARADVAVRRGDASRRPTEARRDGGCGR